MAIASSVLQAVRDESDGGGKKFWTFDESELPEFMKIVDAAGGYTQAVAGRKMKDGWIYHLTAKSPEQMEERGFENMGHISASNTPWEEP